MLGRLAALGRKVSVATELIDSSVAYESHNAKVAVEVDGRYHLLTGKIDVGLPEQTLSILSKVVLKKAQVHEYVQASLPDRRVARYMKNTQRQSQDEHDYSYD